MLLETKGDYEFANAVKQIAKALSKDKKNVQRTTVTDTIGLPARTNELIRDGGRILSITPISALAGQKYMILYEIEKSKTGPVQALDPTVPGDRFTQMLRKIGIPDNEIIEMYAETNKYKDRIVQHGIIGLEHTSPEKCFKDDTVPFWCCVYDKPNGNIIAEVSFGSDISEEDERHITEAAKKR